MTWPSSNVNTTNADAGTDSPALFRADVLDLLTKFNLLRAHVSTLGQTFLARATAALMRADIGAAVSGSNGDITSLSAVTTIGGNPAFTGLPTTTTPSATDNSSRIASTQMVQSVGLHSAGYTAFTASATLTTADFGRACYYASASAGTLTLPNNPPAGIVITVVNLSTVVCTLARSGGATICGPFTSYATTIDLWQGDSLELCFDGTNWQTIASSGFIQGWNPPVFYAAPDRKVDGTVYTNSARRERFVKVVVTLAAGQAASMTVDGGVIDRVGNNSPSATPLCLSYPVPAGRTYSITAGGTPGVIWTEKS